MRPELDAVEARVLGALVEKEITTPEYYPLTLNALVNACNQKSNRDPVVQYEPSLVETATLALKAKGLARVVHPGSGERATKYRQVADEALGLERADRALLSVLLLRGAQTAAELKSRSEKGKTIGFIASADYFIMSPLKVTTTHGWIANRSTIDMSGFLLQAGVVCRFFQSAAQP